MSEFPALRVAEKVETAYDIVLTIALEDLEKDPYPFYQWIRNVCPVAFAPATGRVLVTTWDLCKEAGLNDAVFGPTKEAHETVYGRPNVMSMTGKAHLALRNAAAAPLRPKAVASYRESKVRATAVRYIDAIRSRGSADATAELAEPISMRVIGDVLGFVDIDDATLQRWFYTYAAYLVDYGRDPVVAERATRVKAEVTEYVERRLPSIIESRDGSALYRLFHDGMPAGEMRSLGDVVPTVGVLIVGGFQEPAHAISNTLLGLFGRLEQAARVIAEPDKWSGSAIEEGLRWLPPFGMTEKLTTTDISLGGVKIPASTEVALVIGSANRDPARFDNPEEFDLDRANQGNMSFGFGSHFCIGHNIARTIGEIVLEEMFRRLPNLRLDPNRRPVVHGWLTRAAKSLPLVWDA
jgi:cytochrome P450